MSSMYFNIPSFNIDAGPDTGYYQPEPNLEHEMREVLAKMGSETRTTIDIPFMEGATLTGRRKANGIYMSARLTIPYCADVTSHVHTFLALDDASARDICDAAVETAQNLNWDEEMHPAWAEAMSSTTEAPKAPFTVVVMNKDALDRMSSHTDNLHSLECLTGFFQTLIGQILIDNGVAPTGNMKDRSIEGDYDPEDVMAAVQTGGELPGRLIVLPGDDGYPQIKAHIMDAEMDVFTVRFHSDNTMHVETENLGYLTLERELLLQVLELEEEASLIWEEVHSLSDEREDHLDNPDTDDPLEHLYTHDDRIDVPKGLARELSAFLGVRDRTGE